MSKAIELAAILAREGRLLLLRARPEDDWVLPGGIFPADCEDMDAAMDAILEAIGVRAPAVEEDFLRTVHLPDPDGGRRILNLYGPTEWAGDPQAPGGEETAWFTLEELEEVAMEQALREAVLGVFGLGPPEDDDGLLASIAADSADLLATPLTHRRGPPPEFDRHAAGLDVLRSLGGGRDPEAEAERLASAYPELAGHVVDFALGEVWSDPTLDRRTRSLLVVAMVAALGGRPGALRSHLHGAFSHGATAEEIVETMRMVAVYAGFPAALEAWPVMEQVFARRGVPRPGERP